jgi:hypothetical protein
LTEQNGESDGIGKNITRRNFLIYSAGVAAVTVGATALMGKLPSLPSSSASESTPQKVSPTNQTDEPIVAAVDGDELTVISGHVSVKVKDRELAGLIAEKLQTGN